MSAAAKGTCRRLTSRRTRRCWMTLTRRNWMPVHCKNCLPENVKISLPSLEKTAYRCRKKVLTVIGKICLTFANFVRGNAVFKAIKLAVVTKNTQYDMSQANTSTGRGFTLVLTKERCPLDPFLRKCVHSFSQAKRMLLSALLLQSKEKEIISPRDNLLFFVLVFLQNSSTELLQK